MQKLAILYSRLSGYSAACQRALVEQFGVELLVFHWPLSEEAPFSQDIYGHIGQLYNRKEHDARSIIAALEAFQPQALLISGWMDKAYLKAARAMQKKGIPVIAGADTQWTGSWRQRVAGLLAPWYLHPAIDVLWVTGERQRQLAHQLGYRGERCWAGFYACDWNKFAQAPEQERQPAFLYVGRYLARKGLDTLLAAYRRYRQSARSPWELWMAGAGPLEEQAKREAGVRLLGFVQPEELPTLLKKASAFVLPSRYEPWGVALQEAAASGLPLIASEACGAGVHLLADGHNGFSFQTGNSSHLARCLQQMTALKAEQWRDMSRGSFELSRQYTPRIWADKLMQGVNTLKNT